MLYGRENHQLDYVQKTRKDTCTLNMRDREKEIEIIGLQEHAMYIKTLRTHLYTVHTCIPYAHSIRALMWPGRPPPYPDKRSPGS